jgi:hypothetical protein
MPAMTMYLLRLLPKVLIWAAKHEFVILNFCVFAKFLFLTTYKITYSSGNVYIS